MADPSTRILTNHEALQVIRGAVHAWRGGRISPAKALGDIGDALEASSGQQAGNRELRRRVQGDLDPG
jgi:hypothetical protein